MSRPAVRPVVRVERQLPAPPDVVFARWTDPASMARWLSPTGEAEVLADVRVGGRFTVVMLGEGVRLEHTGEYLAVEPPSRLRFTWASPYTGERPSVVTVELAPSWGGTRLRLVHERLPADQVGPHAGGWGSILDNLAAALAADRDERPDGRS
ncbi:MAG TPA: SRPBCC domain-containing protein [Actinomycetota bacterium]|jgi:uncharacterized protein YndB with AHSA1/START domain